MKPPISMLLAFVLLAGCGGPLVINEGADFPPADDPSAPPLPTDYPWGQPKKEDLDHDGHVDLAYYGPDGSLQGAGFDRNRDGKVDVLRKYDRNGHVVEETRDTDHDGKLDERATDTDGDGTLDKVMPYAPK
jgi:hypothetical protein